MPNIPSRQEMRFILRTHLEENDPATLRRWHQEGVVDLMLNAQADEAIRILKWNLGDDPYKHPDPARRSIAWEYAKAHLLEYPQYCDQPLDDDWELEQMRKALSRDS